MKKKGTAQSGLFGLRPLLALFFCTVGVCSMIAGTLLAFWPPDAPVQASQRTLTFAERVAYQRALEEVYWRHRIWPKQRPDPKPPLDAVMSQAQLQKKVEDYLRKSQALEDQWQRPLSAEQLQAAMDRMAKQTRRPEVLHELFEALGNDAFVIAECLVRPVLTERLLGDLSAPDNKGRFDSARSEGLRSVSMETTVANGAYTLPRIVEGNPPCTDDSWVPTCVTNAPGARYQHTAVWTGTEMIVWGGQNYPFVLNTGGRYNPSTDSWTATSTTNAPDARYQHTAVWTGTEMIVWGGTDFETDFDTGGRYNPGTDSWTHTSIRNNPPSGREGHTAVWTGSQMIIWGGAYDGLGPPVYFNTGGRYNPFNDSWTATSTPSAPSGRELHTAVWTGNEMIIWGGSNGSSYLNTGARYNPTTDTWAATSTSNAPSRRSLHTGVWTATEMIVWGGYFFDNNGGHYLDTGGRYDPGTDSWTPTSTTDAPSARQFHALVWCGSEMIIWGGGFPVLNTGGRYNPATDSWAATSTTNAPEARYRHTAVWTGSEMIVWGGYNNTSLSTGGRYGPTPAAMCPPTPTAIPTITPRRPIPTPRPRPTFPPPPPHP
jgi:N-acetylneuraminic acid mutarotase